MSERVYVKKALLGWVATHFDDEDRIQVGREFGWWRPTRTMAVNAARRDIRRHDRAKPWKPA